MPQEEGENLTTELREMKPPPRGRAPTAFVLEVVDGPDRGLTARVDATAHSRLLVGKSPACGLVLKDPQVSRRHFAVDLQGATLRVTDLSSTNGTTIGGIAIAEAFAAGGETIRAGGTSLRVHAVDDAAPPSVARASMPPTALGFGRLVGASPAMRRLYPRLERLATSTIPVVIEGETGTGKELCAEVLHESGPRRDGPFVVLDCAAVAVGRVEAMLFGEEARGGAPERRGVFEQAGGGTLLLDEIGELDSIVQAKLLRAIDRGEVCRVHGDRWLQVDVRVIATTRRDLEREVEAGRFREDLFFRLGVGRVELPPLRRREGDASVLAEYFWRRVAAPDAPLPPDFLPRYEGYAWPGNVRELLNAVARCAALGELDDPQAAPAVEGTDPIAAVLEMDLPLSEARERVVAEFERRYVERVLARHGGNVSRAAAASGIARRYFQILRARQR